MVTHNRRLRNAKRNRRLFSLALIWTGFALLWAYFGLLSPAFGAEAKVNGRAITFELPTGHCLLDENAPLERDAIDALKSIQKPDGNTIWMFADCEELALLRAGQPAALKHYGQVMAVRPSGMFQPDFGMARFEFTQHIGRNIPALDISRIARTAPGRVAAPNAPLHRLLHFGLATIDAAAAYAGLLIETNRASIRSTTAAMMALTLVKDQPIAVVLYGPYGELADYRALRTQLRPLVGRFIAQNESGAGSSRRSNAEFEAWEYWLRKLATIDWNGAMLGVLLSIGFATLILVAARRFRG